MTTLTVRRRLPAPSAAVWDQLVDLEQLAVDDHSLDLVELESDGALYPGAHAVVSHRHGRRLVTYDVRVVDVRPRRWLSLVVTVGRESWLVEARLRPDADGTELLVAAELDPDTTPRAVLRGLTRPLDLGLYQDVADLVDRWVRHTARLAPPGR